MNGTGEDGKSMHDETDSATGQDASDPATRYGETWVYESIVGAIPGLHLSPPVAVGIQFLLFEGLILLLATAYDLWESVAVGTAAVVVAAAGSYLMLALGEEIRRARTPGAYRRLLFSSSIETVLALLAFVALLTYLLVADARPGAQVTGSPPTVSPALTDFLGASPPAPAVYLALLILWDLCYRIATGWWASLTGLWRTIRYAGELDGETRTHLRRVDLLTVGFALVQLLLVPFVWHRPLLVAGLLGHVLAVVVVSGASIVLLSRS